MKFDPILLEIYKHLYSSVAEEMGVVLRRTSYSTNIKERRDFSCALFGPDGAMVAQAAHIPVHLGSMPLSVRSAIDAQSLNDGDMVMLNDPFSGGTHLPDITLVAPVFSNGEGPLFYTACRAHHADIGGMSSGSMPLSTSIFQEGLIIPPVKIVENHRILPQVLSLILANVRTPMEREGDLTAQLMANRTGIRRLNEIITGRGLKQVHAYADHLIRYSETLMRRRIGAIPDGVYEFEDMLEDDGCGTAGIFIRVRLTIREDTAQVDFSESDDQVRGNINAVRAVTLSAVLYVFRSLISDSIPTNSGCLAPIGLKTRPGSIVDAQFPAAVAAGNVETAQRIVDVLLGALSSAIPGEIPAASQGTMNNITIGGIHPQTHTPYTYYETIGGGMGASRRGDGESAVHSHMTNTLNTPVEALEFAYPFQITRYAVRKDSGGAGHHAGGDGIIRDIRLTGEADVTVLSERRSASPYGLCGGESGLPGENRILRNGKMIIKPGKFSQACRSGDEIRINTPGGGGYGRK